MAGVAANMHWVLLCVALVLATGDPRPCAAQTQSPQDGFNALVQLQRSPADLPDAQQAKALLALYRLTFAAAFEPATLSQHSDVDLRYLFRSANLVALPMAGAENPKIIDDMRAAFTELQRRGVAKAFDYQQMYGAFVGARMLSAAGDFFTRHHAMRLEALPTFIETPGIEPGAATEWIVSPVAKELTRKPYTKLGSAQVLVIGHPLCHFTQNAVRDIFANPMLRTVFTEHAHWLAPQGPQLDMEEFQEWNRDHPEAPMHIAYQASEWPLVDAWATPTFYFLRDGVVAAKVVGWPAEGRFAELREALQRIGLLTRDEPTD